MDGSDRFFKNRSGSFKKKSRKPKWHNPTLEEPNLGSADTIYRILCPSRKIGGVIGKGGSIVKSLREETQAKITVSDTIQGSDERVIIIYSAPVKISRGHNNSEGSPSENEEDKMEPLCAAQDALLKVHDRIVAEDSFGGMSFEDENEDNQVTARLLVPNNMVGCLLGKKGDVIQRLRMETGATIRVLSSEHLPTCAMSTDELVQISGKPEIAKNALYVVSTLLHENPRKEKPPAGFPMPFGDFHPHGGPMGPPPGNGPWSYGNFHGGMPPPMPWMGGYGNHPPGGYMPGGFDGMPPPSDATGEFSMKILCSAGKIGGIIGKNGVTVKQLQQETGASIHVEDPSVESEERVILVTAFEGLWNPRSQTIEAVLQLQNKTSEVSERGAITTRLLVPSSKVGCIIGQGGQIINEMRRRTLADIRIFSKDEKPRFAAEEEELIQISGNFGIAKDALAEIASRLRTRCLRDAPPAEDPNVGPTQGYGPPSNAMSGGVPSRGMGVGGSGGYGPMKGGVNEYERQSYPPPPRPAATGYPPMNSSMDPKLQSNMGAISNNMGALSSNMGGIGGGNPNMNEVGGARLKLQDPQAAVGSECVVEIRGSSEHLTAAAQSILQSFSGVPQQQPLGHHHQQQQQHHLQQQQQHQHQQQQYPQQAYQEHHQTSYPALNPVPTPGGSGVPSSGAAPPAYNQYSMYPTSYQSMTPQPGAYPYSL